MSPYRILHSGIFLFDYLVARTSEYSLVLVATVGTVILEDMELLLNHDAGRFAPETIMKIAEVSLLTLCTS